MQGATGGLDGRIDHVVESIICGARWSAQVDIRLDEVRSSVGIAEVDRLYDVDFAGAGPAAVIVPGRKHPEGGPGSLAVGQFLPDFDSAPHPAAQYRAIGAHSRVDYAGGVSLVGIRTRSGACHVQGYEIVGPVFDGGPGGSVAHA